MVGKCGTRRRGTHIQFNGKLKGMNHCGCLGVDWMHNRLLRGISQFLRDSLY
jgi:hypothetical protein